MIAQRQDRREDLRHADPEVQPDLAEDVDRDDDRRDVEARIADVRQDERVGAAPTVSVRLVKSAPGAAVPLGLGAGERSLSSGGALRTRPPATPRR